MKSDFNHFRSVGTAGFLVFLAAVAPASASVLFFDFGDGAAANTSPVPTNNVTQAQLPVNNATDSTGSATTISLATAGFNPGSNSNGTQAPTGDAAIFPVLSTKDNLFGHTQPFNPAPALPKATLTFSGLDITGSTAYTFDFFASRTGVADVRTTLYSVTGLNSGSTILDAANNVSSIASVTGIIPNASGVITVDLQAAPSNTNGTGFYYIGALRLTTAAVPEPSAAAMLGLALLAPLGRRRRN
ncbi:MAG: PEP-CTERM sorting domain-containing protein [Verrucomicrobiota bacterium]